MSAGLELRKRGKRKEPSVPSQHVKRRSYESPLSAIDPGSPGEIQISVEHQIAITHLYWTSPSVQAARTILQGQLLSSGIVLRRKGKDVTLKPTFSRHLDEVWIPFARSVIDNMLMFGFCVVSIDEEDPPPFANFLAGGASIGTPRDGSKAKNTVEQRAYNPKIRDDVAHSNVEHGRLLRGRQNGSINLVPIVPDVGQYTLTFVHKGWTHYRREYRIFATNSENVRHTTTRTLHNIVVQSVHAQRRPTAKTWTLKCSFARRRTRRETSAAHSRAAFKARASSPRSRNSRSTPRSCARASSSSRSRRCATTRTTIWTLPTSSSIQSQEPSKRAPLPKMTWRRLNHSP